MKRIILDIIIVITLISTAYFGYRFYDEYTHIKDESQEFEEIVKEKEDKGIKYKYAENSEMAGWITVPGTAINYPVMLTPDEPEKYLHLDFNGEYSYSGTPFIDYRCTLDSENIIVYGHNMRNTTMFSTLSYYEDRDFYEANGYFYFETEGKTKKYRVIAAIRTDVDNADDIYGFTDGSACADFVKFIKDNALYDTGYERSIDDRYMTLSTCAYHTEEGRFILVGEEE